jgi:aldose 1-epimerase
MDRTLAPSGEQLELRHGTHVASIATVGASLRAYAVAGADVVDGYHVDAVADGARGQTLIPWPNRVQDGTWSWNGEPQQLALTEPEQHNAIHGLVRWLGWSVAEQATSRVLLTCTSWPQPGYPWPLDVAVEYALDDRGLTVRQSITNRGSTPAPVAAGAHPYLTVGTTRIDDATLHVPADTWIPTGDQQIPTGRRPVEGSPYDFRSPRLIGDTKIDYAFTDLHRDDDGRFRLRLAASDGSRATSFWVDERYPYVEVFTGDALPDEARRRQGLGVEPMSAPPNAMATGEDLATLEPGERWTGSWGIEP